MKQSFGIFTESTGSFSWRKMMTALCVSTFSFAQIGYLIEYKFKELPAAYMAIDAGVFAFYFLKNSLDNIKIKSDVTKI